MIVSQTSVIRHNWPNQGTYILSGNWTTVVLGEVVPGPMMDFAHTSLRWIGSANNSMQTCSVETLVNNSKVSLQIYVSKQNWSKCSYFLPTVIFNINTRYHSQLGSVSCFKQTFMDINYYQNRLNSICNVFISNTDHCSLLIFITKVSISGDFVHCKHGS